MGMSPGMLVLLGGLVLLYGLLIGGTWVRRNPTKLWDSVVQPIIFIVIAAVATIHLVIVGVKQADAFQKAKDRLDCVAVQLDAIRAQAPMPTCDVHWDT